MPEVSPRSVTLVVLPDGGRESRTLRISYARLRLAALAGIVLLLLVMLMAVSWWFLALHALESRDLRARASQLEAENARVGELANSLDELEEAYAQIRELFVGDAASPSSPVWLPPPGGRNPAPAGTPMSYTIPGSWPLTEPGFVTQPLLEGAGGGHPGVDIAVPTGSYIRATAGGVVVEAANDPVYGLFLVLAHDGGYASRYAHASQLFVAAGDSVVQNEVVALSGSTGRSTAPHLHFEILAEGVAVDPLEFVQRP
ncbi:MAG: M23 family metallopeptidase [Gemmatimonadota bacterium]